MQILPCYPQDLSFPNLLCRLDPLNHCPSRVLCTPPLHGPQSSLELTVVRLIPDPRGGLLLDCRFDPMGHVDQAGGGAAAVIDAKTIWALWYTGLARSKMRPSNSATKAGSVSRRTTYAPV